MVMTSPAGVWVTKNKMKSAKTAYSFTQNTAKVCNLNCRNAGY